MPVVTPERIVFRPRRARVVVYACAVAVAATLGAMAVLLPSGGGQGWGVGSRLAVIALAAVFVWFLHRLASVRLVADEEGIEVVNVLSRRHLDWAEVVGTRLTRDDAWLFLDISDGSSLAAMGVQRSEGELAQRQARDFARMLSERSRTEGGG